MKRERRAQVLSARDSFPNNGLESLNVGQRDTSVKRLFDNCLRKRMFGISFRSSSEREKFLFANGLRDNLTQSGMAFGQRSGLVEDHALHAPQSLKRFAGPHKHTALGTFARSANDR